MSNPDPAVIPSPTEQAAPTPLAAALEIGARELAVRAGVRTPVHFGNPSREIESLLSSTGILDLGWRGKILVTGNDRERWLNGMVTNAVQTLPHGEGNYSFLLNSQGRILGDCNVYRRTGDVILDTSRDQIPILLSHLEHYIIMDEVELQDVSEGGPDAGPLETALALAGPGAPAILAALGVKLPSAPAAAGNARLFPGAIANTGVTIIEAPQVLVPCYEVWLPSAEARSIWAAFLAAGAQPAGLLAAESLRVLEGTPLYGVDLNEHDLPQETNQLRALNFNKGCYLGQEIVERIRSRGKVHRQFRQFSLNGAIGPLPLELRSGDHAVGRITSAASIAAAGVSGSFGLGFAREEILARKEPIGYEGGAATPLETPPRPGTHPN